MSDSINSLQVELLPANKDNYIQLIWCPQQRKAMAVDPAAAEPVESFVRQNHLQLELVVSTHHHPDHIAGNLQLQRTFNCQILGPAYSAAQIPALTRALKAGDQVQFCNARFEVWHLPGHTQDSIALIERERSWAFVGDTLFAYGCGRVFEGHPEDLWLSLNQLRSLPPQTQIFCAHEYTLMNLEFVLRRDPENPLLQERKSHYSHLRSEGKPTLPISLSEQIALNPFLQCQSFGEFFSLRSERNQFVYSN